MLFFDSNVQVGPIIEGQIPPLRGAAHRSGRDDSGVGNSGSMQNENILVGYFFQCLACEASFIRTVPYNCAVGQGGEIFLKDTRQRTTGQSIGVVRPKSIDDKRKFVGFVRCPDCLSNNVRLAEIGDKK